MNRKLLNGLLVLAVATGGVGTFTSCKDDDFSNKVMLDELSLQAQVDAIRGISDEAFKQNLEKWLNDWTQSASGYDAESGFASYDEMVAAAEAMYRVYNDIMNNYPDISEETAAYIGNLYDWMFENKIQASDWYKMIYAMSDRASSVEVNQVFNPVFGTINLPVGLNTTVLATYVYSSNEGSFTFPNQAVEHLAEASPSNLEGVASVINSLTKGLKWDNYQFTDAKDFGNMGGAVVTINPSLNDFTDMDKYTVELVNSKGEAVLSSTDGSVELEAYDDVLYFGASRADEPAEEAENNGIYRLKANASKANYQDMMVDLNKSELKDAFKSALKNKSLSSIAHLGETVFNAVNEKLPAYGVKVSWDEEQADETTATNSVTSAFNIAAVVVHPLSYNTQIGNYIPSGKHLPIIHSPLSEYLDRIANKLHLTLGEVNKVENITVDLTWTGSGTIHAIVYDNDGNEMGYVDLTYSEEGVKEIDPNDENLTPEQKQSLDYFIAMLMANMKDATQDSVNDVIATINNAIDDINDQLRSFEGKVEKVQDLIERLKESNKLTYAQKLVDIYNKLAEKANNFLDDPDHYLQVMMAYSAGDGVHHLSNDINFPVTVNSKAGDGLELIAASYTGDIVVPSYKKYVAITGVVESNGSITTTGLETLNTNANLNEIFSGNDHKVIVNVSGLAGKTVRLTYISVDYRGKCSAENYYLRVL